MPLTLIPAADRLPDIAALVPANEDAMTLEHVPTPDDTRFADVAKPVNDRVVPIHDVATKADDVPIPLTLMLVNTPWSMELVPI